MEETLGQVGLGWLSHWTAWEFLPLLGGYAAGGTLFLKLANRYFRWFTVGYAAIVAVAWLVAFPGPLAGSVVNPARILFVAVMTSLVMSGLALALSQFSKMRIDVVLSTFLGLLVAAGVWLVLPFVGLPLACGLLGDCV